MKKIIFLVLTISVILGVVFWFYGGDILKNTPTANKEVELNMWVLGDEDDSALRTVIDAYHKAKPNIRVNLIHQSALNYKSRLDTQLRANQGPDIFPIHNSWLQEFDGLLAEVPNNVISLSEYSKVYYPIFKETLTAKGKIYAMPLSLDGLALYYNEDILKGVGVGVPSTWAEFIDFAKKVTVQNQAGKIQTSGAALGTTTNVDFWPEILSLLLLQQPNVDIAAPNSPAAAEVLNFYTGFITNPKFKTWDTTLPSSTQMFIDGKLAFYFAPAKEVSIIEKSNPNLKFKVAPVPQLSPDKKVALASFYSEAVAASSPNQKETWEFLKFFTSQEALQFIYQQNQSIGVARLPYPIVELGKEQLLDPKLGAFVSQGTYYKTWYLNSEALDNGINSEMMDLYKKAVDSVLQGKDPQVSLEEITPGIGQTLKKYDL